MSQFINDGAEGGALSVQESIIVSSLNSIKKNHDRVKSLFVSCAVFAEDQRVPNKLFVVLHAANVQVGADTKAASMSTVKKWVKLLINRSLLMELVRGSVQMHDSKKV
jgi:hypothetical protein